MFREMAMADDRLNVIQPDVLRKAMFREEDPLRGTRDVRPNVTFRDVQQKVMPDHVGQRKAMLDDDRLSLTSRKIATAIATNR